MSGLIYGYDCSQPAWPMPPLYEVTGGYIGGATPHIWTSEEWDTKARAKRLPIYVPTYFRTGVLTPGTDAIECVNALRPLAVPKGATVGLDFETLIAPSYVESFNAVLTGAGYKVLLYGSSSTVFKNPKPSGGYWVATREGNPDFPGYGKLFPGSVATQYSSGLAYDADIFSADIPFWGGYIPPVTANYWTNTMIQNLPTLIQGASGPLVMTLQGCLCARGYLVAIDGQFGPDTELKVREMQARHNIPDSVVNGQGDGQVGEHTWTFLITNVNQ